MRSASLAVHDGSSSLSPPSLPRPRRRLDARCFFLCRRCFFLRCFRGDEANNALLLRNMATLEAEDRAAFYVAVLVLLQHADDPTPLIAQGRWHGRIATAPRGAGGFGYDPLFVADGYEQHAAELSAEEKNRVSHRALAVQQLLTQLAA